MAAASLRNVEIAATAAEVADGGDDKNNGSRHTRCSGHSNQHTYHQQEHEQPKKPNIYHQTASCHYHTGASILFWLAVILVLGELKTGEFIFAFCAERFHPVVHIVVRISLVCARPRGCEAIQRACIKQ